MSEFRFILNGQVLKDHPDGWQDFTEALVRDEELHGITLEYENGLTFRGDGYAVLEEQFLQSFCNEATMEIQKKCGSGRFEKVTELLIKLTDLDTNLQKCSTVVKATDNGYYGMIHNNRDAEVPIIATLSKNGIEIPQCPSIDFKVFLPNLDGNQKIDYLAETRSGYDHREVLRHVLTYVTDNRINEVQSNYLDNMTFNPDPEYFDADTDVDDGQPMTFVILSGYNLRAASNTDFKVSFKGIIDTLFAKHGLFWRIEGSKIIVEPVIEFFKDLNLPENAGETPSEFKNQPDIVRSMDTTKLYSGVEFGSSEDLKDRDLVYSMPFVELISHQQQRYNLSGVCNTDVTLNLVDGYVYDSNIIEKIIVTQEAVVIASDADQSHDDDIMYIQVFQHTQGESADDNYYSVFNTYFLRPDAPNEDKGVVYNPYLFNIEVSKRHTVQSDYSFYVADNDDNFKAEKQGEDYFNSDFQDATFFFDGGYSNSLANAIGLLTGWGIPPQVFPWGGLVNNSSSTCNSLEGNCSVNPLRIPFSNDSTAGNFDPNDNWDTTNYQFQAPSTGVYGFELKLLINKVVDRVTLDGSGNTINTNLLSFEGRLIRERSVLVTLYMVKYDSAGNYISNELVYNENGIGTTNLQWYNGNSLLALTGAPGNNSQEILTYLANTQADYPSECAPNWPTNKLVEREAITYLQSGEKVGFVVSIVTRSHLRAPITTTQRQVAYGVMPGSTVRTNFLVSGGGEFQAVNPNLHYANLYNFNRPTTEKDWDKIKSDPTAPIDISTSQINMIRAFHKRITRTLATGATEFELIGNRNQPNF